MKLQQIVKVIRESLIYIVFGVVVIEVLLYLIWITSMIADCTRCY